MNRNLLATITLAGIAVGYYATFGRHRFAAIAECHRNLDAAYAECGSATEEASHASVLKETVEELARWREELRGRLRLDPLRDPSLLAITTKLQRAGLAVDQAETLAEDSRTTLAHQRVRAIATCRFADLFAAVAELENDTPPTRVTDLSIRPTSDPRRIRAEMTIVRTGGAE